MVCYYFAPFRWSVREVIKGQLLEINECENQAGSWFPNVCTKVPNKCQGTRYLFIYLFVVFLKTNPLIILSPPPPPSSSILRLLIWKIFQCGQNLSFAEKIFNWSFFNFKCMLLYKKRVFGTQPQCCLTFSWI